MSGATPLEVHAEHINRMWRQIAGQKQVVRNLQSTILPLQPPYDQARCSMLQYPSPVREQHLTMHPVTHDISVPKGQRTENNRKVLHSTPTPATLASTSHISRLWRTALH